MAQIKALFLDRDDTIIKNVPYMSRVEDIEYFPGVFTKLKELQDKGVVLFVVTNQSGLSRGLIKYKELEAIHKKISNDFCKKGIFIRKYYISPYAHKGPRRKPGPELLFEAARDFNIDLSQSVMIGDGLRDVNAGKAAGVAQTFRVKSRDFWNKLSLS